MNETIQANNEKAASAAAGLLTQATQGAHHTIDRLSDGAAPAVRQLGRRLSATEDALRATTGQLRDTRDEWLDRTRSTVRRNPLSAIAIALAVGAAIARISRA